MSICFSHKTALLFWRIASVYYSKRFACTQPCIANLRDVDDLLVRDHRVTWITSTAKNGSKPTKDDVSCMREQGYFDLCDPIHIAISNAGNRFHSNKVVCHVSTAHLPGRPVIQLNDGFTVVAPMVCFLEMAQSYSLGKLIALGCELCGTYRRMKAQHFAGKFNIDMEDGFKAAKPLMTAHALRRFLNQTANAICVKDARQAAKYVVDGSASPMETALYLLLCLPQRMGGYGLPPANLNTPIKAGSASRKATSKKSYRCDLFWSDHNLTVEYDSDLCHTGASKISSDAMRRNSLVYLDVQTITVTSNQVMRADLLMKVATVIARTLGFKLRIRSKDWFARHRDLRNDVLDFDSW